MRVVEISPIIGSGSVGRIVDELYNGLTNEGHECKVVCGQARYTRIPIADYLVTNSWLSRNANAIAARVMDNDGFCMFVPTRRIASFIESFNPDIIHMHGAYGYYLNVEVLYRHIGKKYKIVNTMHSCWDYTGHCCYYTFAQCDRWKTKCHHCPEKHAYPTSVLIDNSKRNYQKKRSLFKEINEMIITPSYWLANEIESSFLSGTRTKVINNGVDVTTFKRLTDRKESCLEKYHIPKDKKIILGVAGVWDKRKGLDDFIELNKILPDDMKIVVVGLNEKQVKSLPMDMIGITRTENVDELVELYSAATVFFNPTYEDNYPTVNLEAIACGTPPVTYDSGGSKEPIRKYEFGDVIKYKDYERLIELTRFYYQHNQNLNPTILSHLSSERMINEYINLFKEISTQPYCF